MGCLEPMGMAGVEQGEEDLVDEVLHDLLGLGKRVWGTPGRVP